MTRTELGRLIDPVLSDQEDFIGQTHDAWICFERGDQAGAERALAMALSHARRANSLLTRIAMQQTTAAA